AWPSRRVRAPARNANALTDPVSASAAHRARWIARNAKIAPLHRQRIDDEQPARERFADAGDQLERLAGLRGADDADQRREYAHRCAPRFLELVTFAEQAVVAGARGIARVKHGDLAIEAQRRAG